MYLGSLDIPSAELEKYMADAEKKKSVCKIVPRGRFAIFNNDVHYTGLVCSTYDMGGEATGVGAEYCKNCQLAAG